MGNAEIIYGNTTTPTITSIWNTFGGTPEVADHVFFASKERTLSALTCSFFVNEIDPSGTFDVTYRIRAVDAGRPGDVLAEATLAGYNYSQNNEAIRIEMPAISLPNDVFVSGQISNGHTELSGTYGVNFANPPEIGYSDPEEFFSNSGDGFIEGNGLGLGWANMFARVEAIPEPISLLALGGALTTWLIRRKALGR